MFKFLKEKLKGAISRISKKVEEEPKVEELPKDEIKAEKIEPKKVESSQEEVKKEEQITDAEIKEEKPLIKEEKPTEKAVELLTEEEKPQHETIEEKPQEIKQAEIKEEEIKKEQLPAEEELKQTDIQEKEIKKQEIKEEPKEAEPKTEETKQKGFFGKLKEKLTTKKISSEQFENLFSDLELILLENNVAFEVIEKIKSDLEKNLVETPIKRTKVEETIKLSLKNSIEDLFNVEKPNLLNSIRKKIEKPFVITFFGINGSGKTTSIAKIANMLKENKISCVLAASDTFRAASIEQLQHHAGKLGIKLIKHDYGSDPAAVAFDAIKHAKAKNIDVVLIDTAGRLHNQDNLMAELKKIIKVTKPDLKIFVGESITGNDCVDQAKNFNDTVGIDSIILTKADVDEKGGTAISISYITKKPIIYLGVGQEYNDIKEFEPSMVIEGLGL